MSVHFPSGAATMVGLFGWPVIDVSRRSVEETSALVLQMLYQDHKVQEGLL